MESRRFEHYSPTELEDMHLEEEAADAETKLREIIQVTPELEQFVRRDNIANAASVIKRLRSILKKNPDLLIALTQQFQKSKKGNTGLVMAIMPGYPLVLTMSSEGLQAFAPVLTCTLNAMDDFRKRLTPDTKAVITTAPNSLIPYVLERSEKEIEPVINYDGRTMNPIDYIALGAQGIFYNEPFRVPVFHSK